MKANSMKTVLRVLIVAILKIHSSHENSKKGNKNTSSFTPNPEHSGLFCIFDMLMKISHKIVSDAEHFDSTKFTF